MVNSPTCLLLLLIAVAASTSGTASEPKPETAAETALNCEQLTTLPLAALETIDVDQFREGNLAALHESGQYQLRSIRIIRQTVFPNADRWLGRLANRLHRLTRLSAIRAALNIAPGATASRAEIAEAERILRDKPFFYDAVALPQTLCGTQLDLLLVVRDVWTLAPTLGASRSGGDNKLNVGVSDLNVLGSGKGLTLEYTSDRDRAGTLIEYRDPNLFNSRWTARVTAADNDDGEQQVLELGRPFFSLDSRWATRLRLEHFERDEDLEFLGDDQFELAADTVLADLFIARSNGRQAGWIDRKFLGLRYFREAVDFPSDYAVAIGEAPPITQRRRFAYPYLGWQRQQDRFVKRANIGRVGITEDIQLGWQMAAEVGWSGLVDDADDALLANARVSHQRFLGDRQLLRFAARFDGRYNLDAERSEAVFGQAEVTYLNRVSERQRFFARARYRHTRNLLPDDQLTLGGDVGLRGYPSRYQPGDRSYLLSLEQRYYSPLTVFSLIRVGFAAFLDAGQAWYHDRPPAWVPARDGDHFGTLLNIGLGLRLESIRTRRDRMVHIDLARPLIDGPGVDDYELTITARRSF